MGGSQTEIAAEQNREKIEGKQCYKEPLEISCFDGAEQPQCERLFQVHAEEGQVGKVHTDYDRPAENLDEQAVVALQEKEPP